MLNEYDSFSLKKNLVLYLDKSGELFKIEKSAMVYKEEILLQATLINCVPPLKLIVTLDYILLAEITDEFAGLLINEPYIAKEMLTDLVRTCCKVLTELEEIAIYLQVNLSCFPDFSNSYGVVDHNANSGMITKYGTLCELRGIEKYTQTVSYRCNYRSCYSPDIAYEESGACSSCGKKLSEVPQSRLTGERVKGLILHPKFLDPSSISKRTQGVLIEFRDCLCDALNIGMRYIIAVTYEGNHYVAWGVIPVMSRPLPVSSDVPLPTFPESIENLISLIRNETHNSPWALVSALAANLAPDLFPPSAFLHLKTALLFSLVSICSKCPVPVLALGDCGNLMTDIWECSPRGILAPNGPASLLLATNGICFLQENIHLSYVTTAIESELVTLKTDKSSKDSKYSTYPLQSAVWVSWQCNKHSSQDIHKLKTLIEIFGIPFLEEIEMNDEDISNHLLSKAINDNLSDQLNSCIISKEDFRKFIDIVSCLHVNMSPMASALIRNYFVASRRERPECLPLKSIKVLTGLSESHTRLSLRDTVTFEDAVAAIFLYEESISVVFGPSMFSKQPQRIIQTNDIVAISKQMDNILGRFSLWLSSYTKTQINNDTFSQESPESSE